MLNKCREIFNLLEKRDAEGTNKKDLDEKYIEIENNINFSKFLQDAIHEKPLEIGNFKEMFDGILKLIR